MKKIVVIALTATALVPCRSFAQTKHIAYRSHSGIDRLFDPDKSGNFGLVDQSVYSVQPDTLRRKDDSTEKKSFGISWNFGSPGDVLKLQSERRHAHDSFMLNRSLLEIRFRQSQAPSMTGENQTGIERLIPSMRSEGEIEGRMNPETPQSELPAVDTAHPPQPELSGRGNGTSQNSATAQASATDSPNSREPESGSGMLTLLALGLGIPASLIVFRGVRRREQGLG